MDFHQASGGGGGDDGLDPHKAVQPIISRAAISSQVLEIIDFLVGVAGFEPATPCPPDMCANRAALYSVKETALKTPEHFDRV